MMRSNKYSKMSEKELIEKLDQGYNGEEDLAEILAAMKDKGISGGLIGFEQASGVEETVVEEYINYHQKLESDKPTDREVKKAIRTLQNKSPKNEAIKLAIITLAHSGKVDALRVLEKFAKKAKGELGTWTQIATQECKMFLESKLEDKPSIKISKVSPDDSNIISPSNSDKLLNYFFRHRDQVERSMFEFFEGRIKPNGEYYLEHEEEESMLMDWIIYDFKFANGKKLIGNYINDNDDKLSKKERKSLEEMSLNKYGFFEAKAVKPDEWIDLQSLHSGRIYRIKEKIGTHGTDVGDLLICRVGKENGEWRIIGSDPIQVPVKLTERAKEMFKNDKQLITPKDLRDLMKRIG